MTDDRPAPPLDPSHSAGGNRFERDTHVVALGAGRYAATIDRGWWVVMGPNGGYIAAIVCRAFEAEAGVAAATQAPGGSGAEASVAHLHSVTLHYLRPPAEGPVEIEVQVERVGRTVSSLTARLTQAGRLIVLGTAAVAVPREALEFSGLRPPAVPQPEETPPPPGEPPIELSWRYDYRPCIGGSVGDPPNPEVEDSAAAVSGGWLRFAEPTRVDAVALVAIADAWWPPIFEKFPGAAMAVPTVDLTVHILRFPADPLDWVLVRFTSPEAAGGYLIEDGEVWDRHGNLLAVCRQLAVVM